MTLHVAFIGSAGIPNRYGGFEAFLEHCAPEVARHVDSVTVTCDRSLYEERSPEFRGVRRDFVGIPANGAWSVLHDLVAFVRVFRHATHIVVLGVSGGPWFPAFRAACSLTGKRLIVNIDGIEWRRTKFSASKRLVLRLLDAAAQLCAHSVVYDNAALHPFVLPVARDKAAEIPYSGDHVVRVPGATRESGTALTVARIEPENNLELLMEGALRSPLRRYTIVGNWSKSAYGRALRTRWGGESRLRLLDPIYEQGQLAWLREQCQHYLHGHSVGGTNPSLVEMLFYDCDLLCFDCSFNRATAGDAARYFSTADELASLLRADMSAGATNRAALRGRYTREAVSRAYARLMT